MTSEKKTRRWNRIPVKFPESEQESDSPKEHLADADNSADEDVSEELLNQEMSSTDDQAPDGVLLPSSSGEAGGPAVAELVATRAELKRVEAEVNELKDRLARRQADFENYRKRVERERSETYNRVVADVAAKLLPVMDNLRRALEAEASVEASESDEFRHFLSGVDLISKQLNDVLEELGVKSITAVGEQFNPHLHEAVVTEASDEYEPDTVMQEIRAG